MIQSSTAKQQTAFTLIEMLVVLVIVGLMATLIVQGFGYSMGVYQRVVKTQKSAYNEVLAYSWLCSTLSMQVAVRPKDRGLEGNNIELTTYSYQPLLSQLNVKTLIGWQLVNTEHDVVLRYREATNDMEIYRWKDALAQFEYLSEQNQCEKNWPIEKEEMPSLPKAVRIVVKSGSDVHNYVVANNTRLKAFVSMDELLYGR